MELKEGNITKIEPKLNPIIPEKVILWNLSNNILINFIKTKLPKIKPIPIGISILKESVEIEFR